jgi:hypothetical protein
MTPTDERLMAYADDELDEQSRIEVEAAMAADPEIARRVAEHRALRDRMRSAFGPVLEEPVPARLLETARQAPAGAPGRVSGKVVPLPGRGRAAPTRSLPRWAALAASLLIGILAGRFAFRVNGPEFIATHRGRVMASGLLADALTSQLAARQRPDLPVRIGVSFRSKSGEYCRTFTLRAPAVAGLACHAKDGWQLQVLSGAERGGAAPGAYRQAASSAPPALVAAVNNEISGEPLDAHAEAMARKRDWQP